MVNYNLVPNILNNNHIFFFGLRDEVVGGSRVDNIFSGHSIINPDINIH